MINKYGGVNRDNLEYALECAKQAILNKKQYTNLENNRYMMWPLFFNEDNTTPEAEIDTCTAALGVIACSKFPTPDGDVGQAIEEGISLLLYMRNEDGSWPSHISLVGKENLAMEGVINDTYFALNALMSVDFLSDFSKVPHNIIDFKYNCSLQDISKRVEIVRKSVQWILDNKVNQGWQYTGTTYLENSTDKYGLKAYTLPSAHVIIILSKIMDSIREYKSDDELIDQIQSSIDDTVAWFCDICNKDGGFGITWTENSRVSNTAKVLLALSCVDYSDNLKERVEKIIHKAAKYLSLHYKPGRLLANDVCEEFSQIIIEEKNGVKIPRKRSITHETFVEPLIIEALINYWNKYRDSKLFNALLQKKSVMDTICTATEYMLKLQVQEGAMRGFVSSRRAMNNQRYTMYSCCDFVCALESLISSGIDRLVAHVKYISIATAVSVIFIGGVAIVVSLLASGKLILVATISVVVGPIIKEILVNLIISRIDRALERRGI